MIRQMIDTLTSNPTAALEDAAGLSAIVVLILVVLHLPVGLV